MGMGSTIPTYYVVPQQRFDTRKFINLAEVEFPTFFNFFVLKKRVKLIVTQGGERCVRTFFREALLGPQGDLDVSATEYDDSVPRGDRPDLRKELDWFSRDFANPGKHMEVSSLVDFVRFTGDDDTEDEAAGGAAGGAGGGEDDMALDEEDLPDVMRADLGKGVVIEMRKEGKEVNYYVIEDGKQIAKVQDRTVLPDLTPTDTSGFKPFQPPTFGLTFLGTSHGFDPEGQTTGFVIWVNGQGVMVDPPPNSGVLLDMMGIPPRLIDTLVLTHCHADHDAGTLQKVLEEGQVTLMTTPTIVGSFSRKYSALTGIPVEMMNELFRFRPVRVGERMPVRGAHFRFFYSLHAVPCVGFEVFLGGKSIVYSADTFNDPAGIAKMHEAGVLSEGRRDALINFPWHHTVVLHEAGVPPIHTPVSYLRSLPEDVKRRLRLVHVTPSSVPADAGLQLAREGPEHSIRISVDLPQLVRAVTVLDLLSYVRFLQTLQLADTRLLLQMSHVRSFSAGETIVKLPPGAPLCARDHEFFMVASGIVRIAVGGSRGDGGAARSRLSSVAGLVPGVHSLTTGNYFPKDLLTVDGSAGPIEAMGRSPRLQSLDAVAQTDVQAVVFNAHEFWNFLHARNALPLSAGHATFATADSLRAVNSALSALTPRQWKQFREMLREREFAPGEALWANGGDAEGAYIVVDGKVSVVKRRGSHEATREKLDVEASRARRASLTRRGSFSRSYERGVLLCEFNALRTDTEHTSQVMAVTAVTAFHVSKEELLRFVRANPVLLLYISARIVCE
uniref:Cyclic nucleotide-binding domain-containing protein n=1 Tax=Bicosoecida sp. CB-2014 TaxID=1486930 RepID=A0A6T6Y1R5_9STRA|mmetsp:Transcript_2597/g.8951  ORF Transcript_2597/g.8951 Transcript_2597/m.8951 type:complete len:786 (+) Transcript_2597:746-3103(+)